MFQRTRPKRVIKLLFSLLSRVLSKGDLYRAENIVIPNNTILFFYLHNNEVEKKKKMFIFLFIIILQMPRGKISPVRRTGNTSLIVVRLFGRRITSA